LARGRSRGLASRSAEDEISARVCWETHLARAEWMTTTGYKDLLAAKITQT